MRPISTSTLACMEIINLCDGAKLGTPTEFELDADTGHILAILVPKDTGIFSFLHHDLYRIPWQKLQCIGEDTILVKLTTAELTACLCHRTRNKRSLWKDEM